VVVYHLDTHFRIGLRHLRRSPELDDVHSGTRGVRRRRSGLAERGGHHYIILRFFKRAPGADGAALDGLWRRICGGTAHWGCHNG
jgi:hypothetical protein